MDFILLTRNTTPIFKYIVWVLGKIMEGIFNLISMIGIPNIGLAIIIFTIVINLIMLPLTIKQQKFSKLSAKMNPEIQAIQAKYKNRKDQDSQLAMNQEIQGIYAKYGVSSTGTCGYLLIQMPILFALYRVIYAMPAYVGKIGNTFRVLSSEIIKSDNGGFLQNPDTEIIGRITEQINELAVSNPNLSDIPQLIASDSSLENITNIVSSNPGLESVQGLVDFANNINYEGITRAVTMYGKSIANGDLSNGIIDVLNKLPSDSLADVARYYDLSDLTYQGQLILSNDTTRGLIDTYNNFLGLNIGDSPSAIIGSAFHNGISAAFSSGMWLIALGALMIPILSVITQWINMKLMPQPDTKNMDEQQLQMQSSMKTMNFVMPLMSAWFCFTLPAGMGLYWVAGSVVRSIQQVLINKHIDKMNFDEIIEKNAEKSAKKMEKLKANQERLSAYANKNTKGIKEKTYNSSGPSNKNDNSGSANTGGGAKPGSMKSKANKVNEYNKKNNK